MTVTFDLPGVYIFRLTADDSALSNHDEVKIETNPVPFTCTAPNVADFFSGVVAGKNRGAPYSELLFLTLLSNGTLSFVSVYGQPGLVWQQESGSGAWTPFFTTDGYCIVRAATPGGRTFLASLTEAGNSIQLRAPNDPHVQAAGILRRAGS